MNLITTWNGALSALATAAVGGKSALG